MKQVPILVVLTSSISIGYTQPTLNPIAPTPPTVESQELTPSIILSNAVQAIGGRRELESITSFQLHGFMRLPNSRPVVELELATSQGGKVLGVMSFVGLGQTRFGSDGTTAWEQSFEPDQSMEYKIIDQATLSQKVKQINWLEWFTMLPKYLEHMEFGGITEFDGEQCLQLDIKTNALQTELAFFSKETRRPKGRRTVEETPNGDAVVDVYFRDWRRVNKLLLFHTVIFSRDGKEVTINLDQIEVDQVEDLLFELPGQVKKLRDQQ